MLYLTTSFCNNNMKNPVAISYVNIPVFIAYTLLQYLYAAVNYYGYPVRENHWNAIPAGKRINFFDGSVTIKIKFCNEIVVNRPGREV